MSGRAGEAGAPAEERPQAASSFGYLDAQRQLVTVDASGHRRCLTGDDTVIWASWGRYDPADVHSWPTWSPDGRRLAAFRISRDGGEARPIVFEASGVSSSEGAPLGGRLPIYLQWSQESESLAILSQDDSELVLERIDPDAPERSTPLLRGSPLFFSWLNRGRIAAFVGERRRPSMVVLGPSGERTDLPGTPGNFCAPVQVGEELVYVAHHRGRVTILVGRPHGTGTRELEIVDGLVALVGSPDGRLARAVAPDGDGSSYRDLRLLDARTGKTRAVSDADCVAFFWARDQLIVARRRPQKGTIAWMRVSPETGEEALLVELQPSRDLRFWLRFFEQYALSHPIVDRDAKRLVLSGMLVGRGGSRRRDDEAPRVWLVPLDGGAPQEVDVGPFATFEP